MGLFVDHTLREAQQRKLALRPKLDERRWILRNRAMMLGQDPVYMKLRYPDWPKPIGEDRPSNFVPFDREKFKYIKRSKPRRGDFVQYEHISLRDVGLSTIKQGKIDNIIWDMGQPDTVIVEFNDGEVDMFEHDIFEGNYVSFAGRSLWLISNT